MSKTFPLFTLLLYNLAIVITPSAQAELSINGEEYISLSEAKWKVRPPISYSAATDECMANHELKLVARLLVDTEGNVFNISVLKSSGYKTFDKMMVQQLKKAEFYPHIINGKPVKGTIILPIKVTC